MYRLKYHIINTSVFLIDLFQLQMNTLRRYKKHYKVTSRPGLNKAQLAEFLTRHLKTIPVVEKEALTYFIYMIKTKKSRLEHVVEVVLGNIVSRIM